MSSTQEKVQRIAQVYLDAAPKQVGDRAVLIADTAKLMRFLLAESLGVLPDDVPVDVAVEAAIEAINHG